MGPPITVISDELTLDRCRARLLAADLLAIDVEGDGRHRLPPTLCTVQIGTREEVFVVDTLAFDAAPSLAPILGRRGAIHVVHDAAFDARMLHAAGMALGSVFDTSVAVRFLGEKSAGLAGVLERHLGERIDKGKQTHDWAMRPLTEEDLVYLASDVVHLPRLFDRLRAFAHERGILEEIEEESLHVLHRAARSEGKQASIDELDPEAEARLSPEELFALRRERVVRKAYTQRLSKWRAERAEERSVDLQVVLPGHCMRELAARRPADRAALAQIGGLGAKRVARDGAALLEICAAPVDEVSTQGSPVEEGPRD